MHYYCVKSLLWNTPAIKHQSEGRLGSSRRSKHTPLKLGAESSFREESLSSDVSYTHSRYLFSLLALLVKYCELHFCCWLPMFTKLCTVTSAKAVSILFIQYSLVHCRLADCDYPRLIVHSFTYNFSRWEAESCYRHF